MAVERSAQLKPRAALDHQNTRTAEDDGHRARVCVERRGTGNTVVPLGIGKSTPMFRGARLDPQQMDTNTVSTITITRPATRAGACSGRT